jgi:MraZ protein
MSEFIGNYSGTFEGRKARMSVPADFRAELARLDAQDLVLRFSDVLPCLEVWPRRAFLDFVTKRVDGKDPFDDAFEEAGGALVEDVWNARIDGDGRLTLPKDLLEQMPLGADVRFTGRLKFFQVWNAADHAAAQAARPRRRARPAPATEAAP